MKYAVEKIQSLIIAIITLLIMYYICTNLNNDQINGLIVILSCILYIISGVNSKAFDKDTMRVISLSLLFLSMYTMYKSYLFEPIFTIVVCLIASAYSIKIMANGGLRKYFSL